MTKFKLIQGSYTDVVSKLSGTSFEKKAWNATLETAHEEEVNTQIKEDLYRTDFVDFKHPRADFETQWQLNKINAEGYSYTQGNMTGAIFSELVLKCHANHYLGGKKLYNEYISATKGPQVTYESLETENYLSYLSGENKTTLSFSYFDDNDILSGFSIDYYHFKPQSNQWSATIIHNTTATPENRQVTLVTNEDLITRSGDKQLSGNRARAAILSNLNSNKISALLRPLFNNDETINLDKLNQLHTRIVTRTNIDNRDEKIAFLERQRDAALNTDEKKYLSRLIHKAKTDINYMLESIPVKTQLNDDNKKIVTIDESNFDLKKLFQEDELMAEAELTVQTENELKKEIDQEKVYLTQLTKKTSKKTPNWVIATFSLLAAGCIISGFLAPLGVAIAVVGVAVVGASGLFIRQKNRWSSEAAELEQQAAYVAKLEEALVEMQEPFKDIEDELDDSRRHSFSSDVTINTGLKKNPSVISSNTDENTSTSKVVNEIRYDNLNQIDDDELDNILKNKSEDNDYYFLNDVGSDEEKDDESETNNSQAPTPKR